METELTPVILTGKKILHDVLHVEFFELPSTVTYISAEVNDHNYDLELSYHFNANDTKTNKYRLIRNTLFSGSNENLIYLGLLNDKQTYIYKITE
jgi:hypothetical protein